MGQTAAGCVCRGGDARARRPQRARGAAVTPIAGDSKTRADGRDAPAADRMRRSSVTEIETLVEDVSRMYTGLERTGIRAIDALSSTDPELVDELLATFESRDRAAN